MNPESLSIIIPVHNEVMNIQSLHGEIMEVCQERSYDFEIIIIDDCSNDGSAQVLKQLSPAKIITFRKNFGQTAAFDAGIKHATNTLIITMDGDGQNDPRDIPKLLAYLKEHELDVVSGWRSDRKDGVLKKVISRGANFLRKILIDDGIHDSGCSLKVYKRECFAGLSLYGEMHRLIPALLLTRGFEVGEVKVNHRPRLHGKSKYNFSRTMKGFLDMLAMWYWKKYSVRPLHLLGGVGLVLIFLSMIFSAFTIKEYLRGQDMSETIWPMLTLFTFLIGIQVIISGLITDILVKTYYEQMNIQPYAIKKIEEQ